ncbi:hypothetical protein GF336_05340 [Candidatus Woesearchaeota archaeon]|nr:hypothetical protein [Candidatus Woesearchaeota archaeon]
MGLGEKVKLELTEIEEKKGDMFLSLMYDNQELGSIYCRWDPVFSTERLGYRRRDDIDEREEIKKMLREAPETKDYIKEDSIKDIDFPFRLLNIKDVPIKAMGSLKKRYREDVFDVKMYSALGEYPSEIYSELREKYKGATKAADELVRTLERSGEYEKEIKKIKALKKEKKEKGTKKSYSLINTIVTEHQNEMMRWELGPFGSYVEAEAWVKDILEDKKDIDNEIRNLEEEFKDHYRHAWKIYHDKIPEKAKKRKEDIIRKIKNLEGRIKRFSPGSYACIGEEPGSKRGFVEVRLDSYEYLRWKGVISAEELYDKNWMHIDIEKPKFGEEDEEVSWIALTFSKAGKLEKYVYTIHETMTSNLDNGARIKGGYRGEVKLIEAVEEQIEKKNPDVISVYNASYDLPEMRQAKEKAGKMFEAGKRKTSIKKDVSIDFFERIRSPGRLVIDQLDFWGGCYDYLPNRKLVMVAREALGEGGKIIDYDQQRELEYLAEGSKTEASKEITEIIAENLGIGKKDVNKIDNLDKAAGQVIANYVSDDTQLLVNLFEHEKFLKMLKVYEFVCNFAKVDYAAAMHSFNSINNAQDRLFWKSTKGHRDNMFGAGQKKKRHERNDKQRFMEKRMGMVKKDHFRGIAAPVFQAYVPVWTFMKDLISRRFPKIDDFYDFYRMQDDKNAKFLLSRYGDSLSDLLVIDFGFYERDKKNLVRRLKEESIDMGEFNMMCIRANSFSRAMDELFTRVQEDEIDAGTGRGYSLERLAEDLENMTDIASEKNDKGGFKGWLDQIYDISKDMKKGDGYEFMRNYLSLGSWFRENSEIMPKVYDQLKNAELSWKNFKHIKMHCEYIDEFNRKYGIPDSTARELLNHWARVKKKRNNILGQYSVDSDDICAVREVDADWNINRRLKEEGWKVVHKKNRYLYLFGKDIMTRSLGDLVITDKLPKAIVASSHSDERLCSEDKREQKIWYKKNRYFHNFKVEDVPDANHYLFEMDTLGKFLDNVLEERYVEALKGLYRDMSSLGNFFKEDKGNDLFSSAEYSGISNKDLIRKSRKSGLGLGFEENAMHLKIGAPLRLVGEKEEYSNLEILELFKRKGYKVMGSDENNEGKCYFYDKDDYELEKDEEGRMYKDKEMKKKRFRMFKTKEGDDGRDMIMEPFIRDVMEMENGRKIWRPWVVLEKRYLMKDSDIMLWKEKYVEDMAGKEKGNDIIGGKARCLLEAVVGLTERRAINRFFDSALDKRKPLKEKEFHELAEMIRVKRP